jgi:Fur family ferric uptake transcriptional regulator
VIEFEDPEHERLLLEIATRLGFHLVSTRLELFGRRPETQPAPTVPAREKVKLRETPPPTAARLRGAQR